MAPGDTSTIGIVVRVDPSAAPGTITNNAVVASATTPDPDPLNNTASATTTIDTSADVAITKLAEPSHLRPR